MIIPSVDMHCHVLYGMDDGAKNLAMSLRMLQASEEDGVERIYATVHVSPGITPFQRDRYDEALKQLSLEARAVGLRLRLLPGAEILYSDHAVRFLDTGKIPTLGNSSYVLVEFSPEASFRTIADGLSHLQRAGYSPVLAHVERYDSLRPSIRRTKDMKAETESLFQMNAGTVLNASGFRAKRFRDALLENGLIDYIASDAHNLSTRKTCLTEAYCWIYDAYPKEVHRKLINTTRKVPI